MVALGDGGTDEPEVSNHAAALLVEEDIVRLCPMQGEREGGREGGRV